ncbi:acyl-CoA dehydrogenase [Nigerium sp.]|uniref:acyl-CoA dehydrogenase family protein n=1 Tax=Nigerium sp. TaxID=2042655 RepID=UPI003221D846
MTLTDDRVLDETITLADATGDALAHALDGPFHAVKHRWRIEVDADDVTRDPALGMAEARDWTLDKLTGLAHRHFAIAGFPAECGGDGTLPESVAHFEMMALGDLSLTIKSGVQHGLFGGAITNLGTAWHHETFLPDTISVALPGCFAMTERGHGSDVQSLETTITYVRETDEFEVNSPQASSEKIYIGNAARDGRMAAVFGQLWVAGECQGVHTILVPIRDADGESLPGVTLGDQGHKGGLLGVDNGTIAFDHVRVPRRMLLDRYGGVDDEGVYHSPIANPNARFFTMLGTLVRGRICVGAAAGSATRKALAIATTYATRRRQFRRPGLGAEIPLLDYLTHQRKLLPNLARAYAYGFAVNELALELGRVMEAEPRDAVRARALETRAAGMKALLTRWANDTVQTCREACGGAGYMTANQLTLLRGDVDVFATFEGDNTVLMELVAKALLLEYKNTWGDMDLWGTAQATARFVSDTIMERTAARPVIDRLVATARRRSGGDLLAARGWHVAMFEERERHTVESLAQRMRAAGRLPRAESAEAISQLGEHMLFAARAHTDRLVLEAFVAGIEQTRDAASRQMLEKLCDLYALATIEEGRAWFLEHQRMDPARSKAVTSAINALCGELRPHAAVLVEGLGVPETWLRSQMLA